MYLLVFVQSILKVGLSSGDVSQHFLSYNVITAQDETEYVAQQCIHIYVTKYASTSQFVYVSVCGSLCMQT